MRHAVAQHHQGLLGVGAHGGRFDGAVQAFRNVLAFGQFACWDLAEILFDGGQRLFGVHVAHDNQRGVVRRIPLAVPLAQIVRLQVVQVAHNADGVGAVGGFLPGNAQQFFIQRVVRAVVHGLAALFADNFHFVAERGIAEIQVGHAVGFQAQHGGQVLRGDIDVIDRFFGRCVGIVFAAQRGNPAAVFAGGHGVRAFEHHVFQGVAEPRFAGHFVYRADFVPQLR